jgi:hypothetical protein
MKYISKKQIIDQHGIQELELFEMVTKQGLQPYDNMGNPLHYIAILLGSPGKSLGRDVEDIYSGSKGQ